MGLLKKKKTILKKALPIEGKRVMVKDEEPKLPQLERKEVEEHFEEGQLAVDVFQTADEIVVIAPISGVTKNDLNLSITDDVLTIRGKRPFAWNVPKEDYFHQECFWGSFQRSVVLPQAVDLSKVKATFKNGVLTVRIPKVAKIRHRVVEIES